MKYYIGLVLLFFSFHSSAQNIVKMSAVKSNDFGVAYNLPKTSITVTAEFSKKTKKAGEYYQYAERYLNISNPIVENEIVYTLDNVDVKTIGVPDKSKSYLVEFKSGSVGAFVSLTADGMICAVNEEAKWERNTKLTERPQPAASFPNPSSFLSEEILRAGSSAKQAELIAKQIYRLRESKTNILTGDAENMPPDGNAYKLIISQIEEQEKALTSLFIGTETIEYGTKSFVVIPGEKNIEKKVIFRFSTKLGVIEPNDLAGAPVYLSLINKEPQEAVVLNEKEQKAMDVKFSKGLIYNIPSKADLTVEFQNKALFKSECDIIQFGKQEVLSPKELEYKKNAPIKITFYPELGSIKQINN